MLEAVRYELNKKFLLCEPNHNICFILSNRLMKRFFRFRCRICMKMLWAKTSGKDNYADKVERRACDYICILHPFHILIFGKKCENDLMIHTNVSLVIRLCLHLRKMYCR